MPEETASKWEACASGALDAQRFCNDFLKSTSRIPTDYLLAETARTRMTTAE